jgi:hypothetical protein
MKHRQKITEVKNELAKEEFYSLLEKVCDAVPNYNIKTILRDFNTKVGKSPLCIQHVEGPAFIMIQMVMENQQ